MGASTALKRALRGPLWQWANAFRLWRAAAAHQPTMPFWDANSKLVPTTLSLWESVVVAQLL